MDPISVVIAALAAGAAAAASSAVGQAATDAYQALRGLVRRRLRQRPGSEVILDRYEENPEPWTEALRAELAAVNAGEDRDLVSAAELLVGQLQGSREGSVIFRTYFNDKVEGVVVGNQNQVRMHFGPAGAGDEPRA
ncbi:hypothetical protein [Frankia gtarii]|uniref:hypothetical protein n=1 Tax=Frankia gtarii TaxID=2950102 RepID=UPI0021BF7179|nr:hypothetical protein [Frankia gtarii]